MVISFTPPSRMEVPPILEESHPGDRLFKFFRARPAGIDVFLYKAGSLSAVAHGRVDETDPITLYDSSGVATTNGWDDLEVVFWGGHKAVVVTSAQAAVLTAAGYTVIDDGVPTSNPPSISSLSPSSGVAGTVVSILGAALDSTTNVTIDGVPVAFTEISSVQVTFTTPAHADAAVTVQVTTPYGTDSHTFTYSTPVVNSPPAITALSPTTGQTGQVVTITGTNLGAVTSVKFGVTAATFSINGPTSITATAPSLPDGAVSVTATDSNGVSNGSTFTYTPVAPSDPHPGADILLEDGSYLLLEDGTSSLLQES